MPSGNPPADLQALDACLARAFLTGDASALTILGYGEISCVVALGSQHVAKPLPPFPDRAAADGYTATFHAYLQGLRDRGIHPVDSHLEVLERNGHPVVWCIQKRLPAESLLPNRLRHDSVDVATQRLIRIRDAVLSAVGPTFGLDAQASNWAEVDGKLHYLDVTTPLMRDTRGREQLDTRLFLAGLPAPLRPLMRRFALGPVVDKYYDPRGVLLDLLGNLHKERLSHLISSFVEHTRVTPPITEDEIHRYYRTDALMWEAVQRARRLDRAWHHLRRRPYPFLLPGRIAR